jgi:hypothetical protein
MFNVPDVQCLGKIYFDWRRADRPSTAVERRETIKDSSLSLKKILI